jgi:hypothetical protein
MQETHTHVGLLLLASSLFAVCGCSEMPKAFTSIELGKPLNTAIIPASTLVNEVTQGEKPCLQVLEFNQSYLPVGLRRYEIKVYRDGQNNVVRVRYDYYALSYWVLLLTGSNERRERFIDDAGKPQERVIESHPFAVVPPFPNFYVFLMGVDQCFHEAERGQAAANAQRHQATSQAATAPTVPRGS